MGATIQDDHKRIAGDPPLYRRIQNTIRERVARGDWEGGRALPSRRTMCTEFGTTQATLDKAIQGLIRDGVLRAAQGSGTFVAETSTERTLRIDVVYKRNIVVESIEESWDDNFYFGPLFGGIRRGAAGHPVELSYTHLNHEDLSRYTREKGLDGMIVAVPPLTDLPALHSLSDSGFPFVVAGFSTGYAEDAALPCVDVDNRQGAADAVRHLLELGHRRIAIVNFALSQANQYDRLEGYRQAMAEAGAPLDPSGLILYPTYSAVRTEARIEEWIESTLCSLPTAIFACDYQMTLAVLRALRRRAIRVPEDISVVGFDDPMSAAELNPPLTTVRQPVQELGRIAVLRLTETLQGHVSPLRRSELLPTKLIVRQSTAPPREAKS